jgi:hypothetical protein
LCSAIHHVLPMEINTCENRDNNNIILNPNFKWDAVEKSHVVCPISTELRSNRTYHNGYLPVFLSFFSLGNSWGFTMGFPLEIGHHGTISHGISMGLHHGSRNWTPWDYFPWEIFPPWDYFPCEHQKNSHGYTHGR